MNKIIKKSVKQDKYSRVLREVRFYIEGEEYPLLTLCCDVIHRTGGYYVSNSQNWGCFRTDVEQRAILAIPYDQRHGVVMKAERDFIAKHDLPDFTDLELGRGGFGKQNKSEVASKARASFRDSVRKAEAFLKEMEL